MTLKPDYLRAAIRTYLALGVFAAIVLAGGFLQSALTAAFQLAGIVAGVGTFFAVCVGVMFVPRELRYDERTFYCRMILQGTVGATWDELEAYGRGRGVFLMQFKGMPQAIQVSGYGFPAKEWRKFVDFLGTTFPDKKCTRWLGPIPILPGQKKG